MKLKEKIIILIISYFSISTLFNISFANNSSYKDKSTIDWQKGYVISNGKAWITFSKDGSPVDAVTGGKIALNRAREAVYFAAKESAIANMAEKIKQLRVDPQNTLLDVMRNNTLTQKTISDILINSMTFKEYPKEFDSSVCEARLHFGTLISSIPYDFPSHDFPVKADIPISTPYTALIIDGRGLDIKPMLFPSIYSDAGLEIYGKNFINSSYAVKGGMGAYYYNEDAQADPRAGEHPYFAVAVKSINNCPVLSEKDIRRILSSQKTINNLKKCRVIFIIDKEALQ